MAVALLFGPNYLYTDANGVPLPYAKIYSYQAGTLVPLALYADPGGSTPLTNPAIADGGGRLTAYATIGSGYKINVLDANNVQVPGWPLDQYQGVAAGNPTLIDDYSATVAQSTLTHDPGEPGAEDLATSMAGELERIRFVLGEMKGGPWNQTAQLVSLTADSTPVGMGPNLDWPNTGTSTMLFNVFVPYDWQSGLIQFTLMRRITAGSGTAIMPYTISRARDGQPLFAISSGNVNLAAVDTVSHALNLSIAASGFQANDWLKVAISRLGDDPGDGSCTVVYDGHVFIYTAIAGR